MRAAGSERGGGFEAVVAVVQREGEFNLLGMEEKACSRAGNAAAI